MSFKFLILLSIVCSSCGMKTRPVAPDNTTLPALDKLYSQEYKQKPKPKEKEDDKKTL